MNDDSEAPPPGSDTFLKQIAAAPSAQMPASDAGLEGLTLGKYEIGKRLGEGGMGVVYEATDVTLQRKVAFKVVSAKRVSDPEAKKRLLREARTLAAVSHPGIALVYEVGEQDGHVFIAMELIAGKTLRAHLDAARDSAGLPLDEAARIVTEAARALEQAHKGGVVHRDLKPENVMLTDSGAVKLLDFGLAKASQPESGESTRLTSTMEGYIQGTPNYMSPEQAKGQKLDARSDLFALGAVYYELVTGRRAFTGPSVLEVLAAIDRDAPRAPSSLRREVGAQLDALIFRCLEKQPAARFQSATELLLALGAPAPAKRRVRGSAVLVTFGVLGIAAAAVLVLPMARRAPAPLAKPDAVLACPQLEVTGGPQPGGWLGAAAANIVCERAAVARQTGEKPPVLLPAHLLGLPPAPSDDTVEDPFSAAGARESAVKAAAARGAAWVDGRVVVDDRSFTVSLELKTPDGETLASGHGTARVLLDAVRLAMEPLWGAGKLEPVDSLPVDVAALQGARSAKVALALLDYSLATQNITGMAEAFARLEPHQSAIDPLVWLDVENGLANAKGETLDRSRAPPLDRSSALAFARSAALGRAIDPSLDAGKLADELHALLSPAVPASHRVEVATLECLLRLSAHQNDRVAVLTLATIAEHGRIGQWYPLIVAESGRPTRLNAAKAYAAWRPDNADTWNILANMPPRPGLKPTYTAVEYAERAVLLAPDAPLFAANLGGHYLGAGKLGQARVVAARLLSGSHPGLQLAGEIMMMQAEAGEARFAAAYERLVRVLATRKTYGSIDTGDVRLLMHGVDFARLLGKSEALAAMVYEQLVKPEPHHLDSGPWGVGVVAEVCAFGAPAVAKACTERIERLVTEGKFINLSPAHLSIIEGAALYAQGRYADAATALRKGLSGVFPRPLVVDSFDRSGDLATGSQLDSEAVKLKGPYNGAGSAHLREARRAWARGDKARARELAQQVVDAWTGADVELAAVKEMRELLAKGP